MLFIIFSNQSYKKSLINIESNGASLNRFIIHFKRNNNIVIQDKINERDVFSVVKNNSMVVKILNFLLLVKAPSNYQIYKDGEILYGYKKEGSKERVIKDFQNDTQISCKKTKVDGDNAIFCEISNNSFRLQDKFGTTCIATLNNKDIASINIQKDYAFKNLDEDKILIDISSEEVDLLPIISLLYLNEFYYNR